MKFKISELLYRIILVLLILDASFYHTVLTESFKNSFHYFCLMIVMVFSLMCIISKRYTKIFLFLNVAIFIFALISYRISGNSDIFTSILLIMLAWKIDLDEILKVIFNVRFIVFIFIVFLSLIGILDIGTIATTSADKGVLLGYGHANTFAGSAGILIFLMFAINRYRIKNYHYIIALITDILIFYFSRSRTALMLISFVIICVICIKSSQDFNRQILKMSKVFLPSLFIVLFTLILMQFKSIAPHFLQIVDKVMNGRIVLSCMNLSYYPITLLGQKIDISYIAASNTYYALDNGYIYVLIHYGIIGLVIIAGLQQFAILRCVRMKEPILCIVSIAILVWMMYEGMMIATTFNFTLLFSVVKMRQYSNKKFLRGEVL